MQLLTHVEKLQRHLAFDRLPSLHSSLSRTIATGLVFGDGM